MKFTFDKDAMIKEIAIAQEIISTKTVGSILLMCYCGTKYTRSIKLLILR